MNAVLGLLLSLWIHWGAETPSARGAEIWLHHAADGGIISWAADVVRGLEAAGLPARAGTAAKGVYRGFRGDPATDYYCNSGTGSPSMLIELGFVTNPEDNTLFDERLDQLVQAIADAACRKLGIWWERPPENSPLYRVQVGAYSKRENAERMADELRESGFQATVK